MSDTKSALCNSQALHQYGQRSGEHYAHHLCALPTRIPVRKQKQLDGFQFLIGCSASTHLLGEHSRIHYCLLFVTLQFCHISTGRATLPPTKQQHSAHTAAELWFISVIIGEV